MNRRVRQTGVFGWEDHSTPLCSMQRAARPCAIKHECPSVHVAESICGRRNAWRVILSFQSRVRKHALEPLPKRNGGSSNELASQAVYSAQSDPLEHSESLSPAGRWNKKEDTQDRSTAYLLQGSCTDHILCRSCVGTPDSVQVRGQLLETERG